ncbi:MAG: diphosphate--fructose-6-phosphate 1-phosphotransferase [Chloroflexota bacterium]
MKRNLLIGQSGGPTAVINATLAGIIRAAKTLPEFGGVYGLAHGLEGALNGEFIDLGGLTGEMLDILEKTPGAALGSSRRKLDETEYARVIEQFRAWDIGYLAYLGGNGSMWVANHLAEIAAEQDYDLQIIGVPKTVDNDLPCTDHTPGYGSGARFIALAARDAGLDLEAMQTFDDVVILESMGRDSGWLAAASGLLKESDEDAPHLIYVPEIPFTDLQLIADVACVHGQLGHVFVVVAEGIRDAAGEVIGRQGEKDTLGRTIHGLGSGPAMYLAGQVHQQLGLQVRVLRPGVIGRAMSACVSEVDREEAYRLGEAVARLLADGESGVMVQNTGLSPTNPYMATIPLATVAGADIKRLPRDYMDANGKMISEAFRDYALPLIGDVQSVARLKKTNLNHRDTESAEKR